MTIQLAGLDPEIRAYAEAALASARQYRIPVQVTSTRRTWAEQKKLRDNWDWCVQHGHAYDPDTSRYACKYPANEPGESAHNYGLAWDSAVDPEYDAAWQWIRRWHGWEVLPNDVIHAQVRGWQRFAPAWKGQVG